MSGKQVLTPPKYAASPLPYMAIALGCLCALSAGAQSASPSRAATLQGTVVNAMSGQPVNRALVNVGQHAMLTGRDGRFEFSGLTEPSVQVLVTKPGFYSGFDAGQEPVSVSLDPEYPGQGASSSAAANSATSSAASASEPVIGPVEIRISPEALLTGTVSAPNGDPLPQIAVQVLRRQDQDMGPKWAMSGQSSTNSDGQFRLTLPPGDYIVETQFAARIAGTQRAALPILFPEAGNGSGSKTAGTAMMHLIGGAEEHLDLRPQVKPTHAVHLHIDSEIGGVTPQLEARLTSGLSFRPGSRQGETSGEIVTYLPSGTYLLIGTARGHDGTAYGEARVTVGGEDIGDLALHMTKAPGVNISVTYEASEDASTGTNANGATLTRQMGTGFFFPAVDGPIGMGNQTRYVTVRNGQSSATDLSPGRYRMRAQPMGQWYVESASLGNTNLLTEDLVVSNSSSGGTIQVVMSDKTGNLQGSVKLNGKPASCRVYLVATTPSANPLTRLQSAADGSLIYSFLPPGDYQALAFEKQQAVDLLDPEVMARFSPYAKSFSVTAGETATVMLDAVPVTEVKP